MDAVWDGDELVRDVRVVIEDEEGVAQGNKNIPARHLDLIGQDNETAGGLKFVLPGQEEGML